MVMSSEPAALFHAPITKASLTAVQAISSTPLALSSSAFSTKPGQVLGRAGRRKGAGHREQRHLLAREVFARLLTFSRTVGGRLDQRHVGQLVALGNRHCSIPPESVRTAEIGSSRGPRCNTKRRPWRWLRYPVAQSLMCRRATTALHGAPATPSPTICQEKLRGYCRCRARLYRQGHRARRIRPRRDRHRRNRNAGPDGHARGIRCVASRSRARASPARCT